MIIVRRKRAGTDRQRLAGFLARARRAAGLAGEVNVLITNSGEIRALNRRYRGKDRATDVLSFPAADPAQGNFAGDIAISGDIAARSARRFGHSYGEEVEILLLHGLLHLAGYDHERDGGSMRRLEARLRRQFRLPPNLIHRATGAVKPHPTGRHR